MAWEHLSVTKPHLVYIILGGFTSLFMLCSSVIKERLYIGEATVATLCGIIFGPHAADLIDPGTWGNVDLVTLEFSRIVLVVQCFAVGVELPKYYMEKHWKSVVFLLVPVMTFGWLVTSLFIWLVFSHRMNWLDSLCCAACVTATDPVLASSVVGKGKFAKRVPRHLRDLLSAESGCNDGMAFPFIYLAIYLIRYRPDADEVSFHWFCYTILYECIFGAIYGVLVGYAARKLIRYAHERDLVDRESFLVFYFVLALFCAGSGSLLGMDDLLVGFACGVGFSNDGWFTEKTEESHVSNVIDLLINLAFFVYLGTIIPWEQYNSEVLGTSPWRLVVIALLVLFFRRIPIMLALKPFIPDVETWREALFAGHFGPIGVGAIFVAILARAELETEETTPLAHIPEPGFEHLNIIELIWPITTFLVITSILVHGSSIAVFTLGKHINTLTISMSYTQDRGDNYNWMDRLPRIQSRSKSQMSLPTQLESEESLEEKLPAYPSQASLGDRLPRNFLRRQKEDDTSSRASSTKHGHRRKKWDSGLGPGGPVSQSAIAPAPRVKDEESPSREKSSDSDTLAATSVQSPDSEKAHSRRRSPQEEVYQEGKDTIIEDEEGNVLEVMKSREGSKDERKEEAAEEAKRLMEQRPVEDVAAKDQQTEYFGQEAPNIEALKRQTTSELKDLSQEAKTKGWKGVRDKVDEWNTRRRQNSVAPPSSQPGASEGTQRAPARAFRYGQTIIVEDEDGEVIKRYDIPPKDKGSSNRKQSYVDPERTRQRLQKMGSYLGLGAGGGVDEEGQEEISARPANLRRKSTRPDFMNDDDRIRFTMEGAARKLSTAEFIKQIQSLDPKARAEVVEGSDAPEKVKDLAREDQAENVKNERKARKAGRVGQLQEGGNDGDAKIEKTPQGSSENVGQEETNLQLTTSNNEQIPFHSVSQDLERYNMGSNSETAAQRRRRLAANTIEENSDSDDDGTERIPPAFAARRRGDLQRDSRGMSPGSRPRMGDRRSSSNNRSPSQTTDVQTETAAERRRRLAALGSSNEKDDRSTSQTAGEPGETAAERRRRQAALGQSKEDSDTDEDESKPREPKKKQGSGGATAPSSSAAATGPSTTSSGTATPRGIRFAAEPSKSEGATRRWGDRGRKK